MNRVLLPEGWPRPKGYSNGVAAEGRMVFVAGQIGWDTAGAFDGILRCGQEDERAGFLDRLRG